ncbi:hypothetical protein Baya_13737 [Bagarius yarrelli]|uniref:Uncharacterized protein n=1 Tax=Bagarius yarrelli TaxID=175774 RepID=A0A556V6X9_BAGYA|nr:hypothetical protein Baya_13737 [Bagarius yarrelli]
MIWIWRSQLIRVRSHVLPVGNGRKYHTPLSELEVVEGRLYTHYDLQLQAPSAHQPETDVRNFSGTDKEWDESRLIYAYRVARRSVVLDGVEK